MAMKLKPKIIYYLKIQNKGPNIFQNKPKINLESAL